MALNKGILVVIIIFSILISITTAAKVSQVAIPANPVNECGILKFLIGCQNGGGVVVGPQGPPGPQGPAGSGGKVVTGEFELTAANISGVTYIPDAIWIPPGAVLISLSELMITTFDIDTDINIAQSRNPLAASYVNVGPSQPPDNIDLPLDILGGTGPWYSGPTGMTISFSLIESYPSSGDVKVIYTYVQP